MHEVPSLMEEYAIAVDTPFQTSPRLKTVAAQFICRPILYGNDSNDNKDVDLMRLKVFSQKTQDVERIPPQRVMPYIYISKVENSGNSSVGLVYSKQPSGQRTAHRIMMPVKSPVDGRTKMASYMYSSLRPIWLGGTLAGDVSHLDVKHTCTSPCYLAKGTKSKLKCTRL